MQCPAVGRRFPMPPEVFINEHTILPSFTHSLSLLRRVAKIAEAQHRAPWQAADHPCHQGDSPCASSASSTRRMAENADDFVAGWASGVAGLMATQPIDYVLTRLQSGSAANAQNATGLRGLVGMWRGVMPLVATVPINNAMLMYGYGVGKGVAERENAGKAGDSSLWPIFLGGCAGGFVQSFLQSPVELVKVRLQLATLGEVPSTSALTLSLLRPGTAGAAEAGATSAAAPLSPAATSTACLQSSA